MDKKIRREIKTLEALISIYCEKNHRQSNGLCDQCQEIKVYAINKIKECPDQPDKPICESCSTHCYEPVMRERIKEIMRFSGPRIIWRHPILTIDHIMKKYKYKTND